MGQLCVELILLYRDAAFIMNYVTIKCYNIFTKTSDDSDMIFQMKEKSDQICCSGMLVGTYMIA